MIDRASMTAAIFLFGALVIASIATTVAPVVAEHGGMNGTAHSILCPFMGGVSAACTHPSFPEVPALPVVFALVLLVGVLQFYVPRVAPGALQRSRHYSLPPPYYQELFSNGILNTKRF